MQDKNDKISPIKQRILQFIKYKGISKQLFCDKTNISYSNIRSKSLESEFGGGQIAQILSAYNEISPVWLLTGTGDMIKKEAMQSISGDNNVQVGSNNRISNPLKPPLDRENEKLELQIESLLLQIKAKDAQIELLKSQLSAKDAQIDKLLSIISK